MRTGLRLAVVLALASAARARAQGLPFQTIDVPGASSISATGINGRGQVVGFYFDSGGAGHGFLASGGTFATIDEPGAGLTEAFGIDASGEVVGRYDSGGSHGFLASDGRFATIDLLGAGSTIALGINGRAIVGQYEDAGGVHGFLATVPEPTRPGAAGDRGRRPAGLRGVSAVPAPCMTPSGMGRSAGHIIIDIR